MSARTARLLALVWLSTTAATAHGRIWRIELDGSGDFTDIQPAVEASAAGDTILIGPGRFDQLHPCTAPAWVEDAVVAVVQEDLTFIGAGVDQTFIGMATPYAPEGSNPKGFCSIDSYSGTIRNLTIENIETGIYWWRGRLDLIDCKFKALNLGFASVVPFVDRGTIRNCDFEMANQAIGLVGDNTIDLTVSDCNFEGYGQGFTTSIAVNNVSFENCTFRGNSGAVAFGFASSGSIRNTRISESSVFGVMVTDNSNVVMENVEIVGGNYGIIVDNGSIMSGADVIVQDTSLRSINMCCNARVTLNHSHILPRSGTGVRAYAYTGTHVELDFSGNYWGTTDESQIAAMILDSNDDSAVHCTIQFLPFANGPVPTESTSWGDLKALFR